ncbi:MAG TPA: hypothetical protein VF763_04165 [Candidatus Limnocylindrales bacterium]
MHRMIVALSAAALLIAVAAPAANASGPQAVTISSVMTITGNGTNTGSFEASGPAVTRGLICRTGAVTDVYIDLSDPTDFPVAKAFVCAGGGPTILVRLQVREGFSWAVQGGSGPYRGLFGSGVGSTVTGPGVWQVTDTYTGTVTSGAGQNQQ